MYDWRQRTLWTKDRCIIEMVIIVILLVVLLISIFSNGPKNNIVIQTDRQAIISRFPNIGEFEKCCWEGDLIRKNHFIRAIGPSPYWMSGFVQIDKNKANTFIQKYNMLQLPGTPKLKFSPKDYNMSNSKWFYSHEFNDYIISPGFVGEFYIDTENSVIYFNVKH